MPVHGIDHINIHTTDLAGTIAFYEMLGLENRPKPSGSNRGAWLYVGDVAIVHLNEADAPPSQAAGPVNHVALSIDDVDAMTTTLDEARIVYDVSVRDDLGITQIFTTDPNGVALELQARH